MINSVYPGRESHKPFQTLFQSHLCPGSCSTAAMRRLGKDRPQAWEFNRVTGEWAARVESRVFRGRDLCLLRLESSSNPHPAWNQNPSAQTHYTTALQSQAFQCLVGTVGVRLLQKRQQHTLWFWGLSSRWKIRLFRIKESSQDQRS